MKRFYVYRLFHQDTTLYIGKGCGPRLQRQKRAFGVSGEVVKYFDHEDQAYRAERALIAKLDPPLNKSPGGWGGVTVQLRELPNGLTPEGLDMAAPHLARLIYRVWKEPGLVGLLSILEAYLNAHGFERIAKATAPYIARRFNTLASENRP